VDFSDGLEEAAFRHKVKRWLSDSTKEFREVNYSSLTDEEELVYSRRWIAKKADAGFAAMRLPREYGGMDATSVQCAVYAQEESEYNLPTDYFDISLGMAIPTLVEYAKPEQNRVLIPKVLKGEHIWCQLFSEPSAGSDLAGISCSAEVDGDGWKINGQKVWTTHAQHADYGILLARSNPELPKHRGLTYFFVDMKSPGVEVKPIRQIDGSSEFNEVFFTDVHIPDSQRLGAVGEGFRVALHTLSFERQAAGELSLGLLEFEDMFELAISTELEHGVAVDDPLVGEKIVDWYLIKEGLRFFGYRQLSKMASGEPPGPEAAIGKLLEARGAQVASKFSMDLLELMGAAYEPALLPRNAVHQKSALRSPGIRIAGGTDEILRNTIAEQVLKLPRVSNANNKIPFNQI